MDAIDLQTRSSIERRPIDIIAAAGDAGADKATDGMTLACRGR